MATSNTAPVLVLGPTAWNTMIRLDRLPDPHPQMLVAQDSWDTVGGTSAGKAVHLHDLGVPARLLTPLADDEPGRHARALLAGIDVQALPTARTERHVNLMATDGGRLSIYATPPADTTPPPPEHLHGSPAIILDLAPWTRELALALAPRDLPVWTDLHDIDPASRWHEPFWRAARFVQCSNDHLSQPLPFLHHLVDTGVDLAICTLGADGAIAVDQDHHEHHAASPTCEVVDTNGAGDAFLAGVLAATLAGAPVEAALLRGADHAVRALTTRDIGPGL